MYLQADLHDISIETTFAGNKMDASFQPESTTYNVHGRITVAQADDAISGLIDTIAAGAAQHTELPEGKSVSYIVQLLSRA